MRKFSILAVLAVVLLFSACGKESGEVKLLESITQEGQTIKFEYDDKNRIVKMGTTTITYKGNDLVIIDGNEYKRKGNVATINRNGSVDSLTLDKDGFITRWMPGDWPSGVLYDFVDGNLTSLMSDEANTEYKYDDKKSPVNCNTPKWIIQSIYNSSPLFWPEAVSKNNVIEKNINATWSEAESAQHSYQYEYDSDGFPTKRTSGTKIATFTYRGDKKEEQEAKTATEQPAAAADNAAKATPPTAQQPAKEAFRSVKIGTQTWMAENLNDASKGGKCYFNDESNCAKYGRLYTWDEAMKGCPSGWHLPNDEEWEALMNFTGGEKKLKAKSGWVDNEKGKSGNGTDEYGFSALPGGSYDLDGIFGYDGGGGYWWISTSLTDYPNLAYYWYMGNDYGKRGNRSYDKSNQYSVRCIKD